MSKRATKTSIGACAAVRALLMLCFLAVIAPAGKAQKKPSEEMDASNRPVLDLTSSASFAESQKWLQGHRALVGRGDVCTLRTSWAPADPSYRGPTGSLFSLASFVALPEDEEVKKIIRHEKNKLDVRVAVQYLPMRSGVMGLRIEMSIERDPADKIVRTTSSSATTLRGGDWGFLEVERPTQVGDLVWNYSFVCTSGKGYLQIFERHKNRTKKR